MCMGGAGERGARLKEETRKRSGVEAPKEKAGVSVYKRGKGEKRRNRHHCIRWTKGMKVATERRKSENPRKNE